MAAANAMQPASELDFNHDDETTFFRSVHVATETHDLVESYAIQTWVNALSEEGLSEAIILRDDHFVSTILDLHSSAMMDQPGYRKCKHLTRSTRNLGLPLSSNAKFITCKVERRKYLKIETC